VSASSTVSRTKDAGEEKDLTKSLTDELIKSLTEMWASTKKSIEASIMEVLGGTYTVNVLMEVETIKMVPIFSYRKFRDKIIAYSHIGIDLSGNERPGPALITNDAYRLFYAVKLAHSGLFNTLFPDYLEQQLRIFGSPHYTGAKYVSIDGGELHVEQNGEGAIVILAVPGVIVVNTEYSLNTYHQMRTTKYKSYFYQFTITVTSVELMNDFPDWYAEIEIPTTEQQT